MNDTSEIRHTRVLNCLDQLQSMNLDRPEGVVINRRTEDILPKLPKIHAATAGDEHAKAAQYEADVEELIDLHRGFAQNNQRLWKKVTQAVAAVSGMYNRMQDRVGLRDIATEIARAMQSHVESEQQKLLEVKTALQRLKHSGSKGGGIRKSDMQDILGKLGIEKILEVQRQRNDAYTLSIMDQVNLAADYWLNVAQTSSTMVEFDDRELQGGWLIVGG